MLPGTVYYMVLYRARPFRDWHICGYRDVPYMSTDAQWVLDKARGDIDTDAEFAAVPVVVPPDTDQPLDT
jgi:hypothetical protein